MQHLVPVRLLLLHVEINGEIAFLHAEGASDLVDGELVAMMPTPFPKIPPSCHVLVLPTSDHLPKNEVSRLGSLRPRKKTCKSTTMARLPVYTGHVGLRALGQRSVMKGV